MLLIEGVCDKLVADGVPKLTVVGGKLVTKAEGVCGTKLVVDGVLLTEGVGVKLDGVCGIKLVADGVPKLTVVGGKLVTKAEGVLGTKLVADGVLLTEGVCDKLDGVCGTKLVADGLVFTEGVCGTKLVADGLVFTGVVVFLFSQTLHFTLFGVVVCVVVPHLLHLTGTGTVVFLCPHTEQ